MPTEKGEIIEGPEEIVNWLRSHSDIKDDLFYAFSTGLHCSKPMKIKILHI